MKKHVWLVRALSFTYLTALDGVYVGRKRFLNS